MSPVSSSSFNGEDQPDVLAATFPPRQPSTNYDERLPDGKQFEGSLPSSANMWLQVLLSAVVQLNLFGGAWIAC